MNSSPGSLRVLIVEDEAMVAMLLEEMLTELGHDVIGIGHTLDRAIELAEKTKVDLAILDVNVRGQYTYRVAEILQQRAVRFLFATGYGGGGLEPKWRNTPTLQKPFQVHALKRKIEELFAAE